MSKHNISSNDKPSWKFSGVTSPNTTQVPDQYLDELLTILSGAELKVLLYITRRTFGFKKSADNISLSQMLHGITTHGGQILDHGTGLSKKTLLAAIKSLTDKEIVLTERRQSAEKGFEATTYRLNIVATTVGVGMRPPLGEKVHQGVGGQIPPSPRGKNSPIQQTVKQQTDFDLSKVRKAHVKKSDWARGGSAATASVTDGSVSRPTTLPGVDVLAHQPRGDGERHNPARAAVAPPAASNGSGGDKGTSPTRTPGLDDSVAKSDPTGEPSETDGEGYRRFREQAMKLRSEAQQEPDTADLHGQADTRSDPSGMTPIAAVLPKRRGRPPGSREDREHIEAFLSDFAREFNDEAPLSSSITRALNLFARAKIHPGQWGDYLYQARAITRERTAVITKQANGKENAFSAKNKVPYFFAVLEELTGLKDREERSSNPVEHIQ